MKKLISIICIVMAIFIIPITVNAAETPIYDETYNNGQGAFYANGTSITILENEDGDTVVQWDEGSQVISNTTAVFGGGIAGTNYNSSNIIMEGGTVGFIYGGGISTSETESADVTTTNITVNNGTVTGAVIGGGLLYSKVETSNVIINNGTIAGVQGGGIASATIDGVNYNTGTEENSEESLTRVENANVTINGGTINSETLGYGLVYGGGQGYSYTGNANLTINGGDMSTAYVTAGGSNGYTGEANVRITGGDINIYQSVNRGEVESASQTITGGNITNLYVGGETGDASVDGTIGQSNVNILGGTVQNLSNGTNNGQQLNVDGENFSTVVVSGTVENNNIEGQDVEITYTIEIDKTQLKLNKNQSQQLEVIIITEPEGYENLFNKEDIIWSSSNEDVATVDSNGVVTGVETGDAIITAQLGEQTATSQVEVVTNNIGMILGIILAIIIALVFLVIVIFRCL